LLNILKRTILLKDQPGLIKSSCQQVSILFIKGNEVAPTDEDWIYTKVASLARKIYIRPRAGVRLLSHIYGGLYRGKVKSERHEHASTKVIRWGLQQLEKQKIIKKDKKGDALKINSRIVTD
jgi:ribosomal protein S19E (S16A)